MQKFCPFVIIAILFLYSIPASAQEIWMFAGPHVNVVAKGWEGLRTDAGDMWKPNAPWETVARSVKVIQFAPTNVDHASASDLRAAIGDIKRRNISLAVGDGLLVRSDRCRANTEAYVNEQSLEGMFQKLRNSGADVKYVTMDEPFFWGHRDSSPTACHESPEALAHALVQGIAIVRKYFPNAQIGTDEVIDANESWVQDVVRWTDTYKAITGEPLAYVHTDLDWSEGAVRNLVPLAAALKQRHIPLGIIYDADRFSNNSDENWSRNTVAHFAKVESELGVHPDHAVIETWVRVPTRMLPENTPGTFTNVVLQYIQRKTGSQHDDLPPFRSPDGPGAPNWTVVGAPPGSPERRGAAGMNAPVNQNGDFLIGPDYVPAPEWKFVPGTPQGTVSQFTLESKDSKYYPGIARDAFGSVDPKNPKTLIVQTHAQPWQRAITVYIPAQYKGGTEAPFLVVHDGPKLGSPDMDFAHVLDNLINQHRVPAMIAIMIQNGGGDAQGSERGLEYDTVSGKFAEFVEHEVLPEVEARYHIQLTHDPEGRAAMGCSSGAAAAFTMAWFHPEWYHRVISYSGTFVNQQWPYNPASPDGAWDYHETLIASAKPKPIRIWMQVADRDLLNPNVMRDGMHDWVVANHRMAAVLEKKGYQYQYVFTLNAGHCAPKVRGQTLPEALEWVWQGYALAQR